MAEQSERLVAIYEPYGSSRIPHFQMPLFGTMEHLLVQDETPDRKVKGFLAFEFGPTEPNSVSAELVREVSVGGPALYMFYMDQNRTLIGSAIEVAETLSQELAALDAYPNTRELVGMFIAKFKPSKAE